MWAFTALYMPLQVSCIASSNREGSQEVPRRVGGAQSCLCEARVAQLAGFQDLFQAEHEPDGCRP